MEKDAVSLDRSYKEYNVTLEDTKNLMCDSEYKNRFIAEYMQLKIRTDKLHKMLVKFKAGTLNFKPTCDILILEDQLHYMTNYLENLEIRAEIEKIELPKI